MTSRLDSTGMEHRPVFSWHRTHDGLIYTSGHAAVDVDGLDIRPGDFRHEVRMTLDNLRRTLERAGSGLAKVIKVTAYITDMNDFPAFNQIYAEFFPGDSPPARTCVEVKRLPYNFKVEIEAIAADVMSARGLVLALLLSSACAHGRPSPFDGHYATAALPAETKVMLVAGGDDVANFAAEIVEQRRMWRAAGVRDDEIACYWAQPTERAWAKDRRQYRRLAGALAGCRAASAEIVLAEIADVGRQAPPWFYLYVTTHGVQMLAAEGSGWYLDAGERDFLGRHALSLDANPRLRLQHVGNILAARRNGAPDDALVMTPVTLRHALAMFPPESEKIVVLQGCFSGGFIDEPVSLAGLRHTTVLTAAATNRPSFGCGSGTRTTFWGGALDRELRKRLHRGVAPNEVDWHAVHETVSRRVTHLERALGQKPSQPQFLATE